MRNGYLFASALAVLAALAAATLAADPRGGATAPAADLERGRALYERHCSVCHGDEGRGDGPAAYLTSPAPRDFGSAKFRLISTVNGAPTQGDLIAAIRNGMPGSAMPPWEWLAEEDLWNTALYVRHLAVEGLVADLQRWAQEQEEELSPQEARAIAEQRMRPRETIEVGAPAPSDPVTLHQGRRLYLKTCAGCHGVDGTGQGAVSAAGDLRNEDGSPTSARDFTAGIFKGGSTHADIVRRIVGGLPGSPMPATRLESPEQVSALAAYVRGLIRPGSTERVKQARRTVPVARTQGALPTEPGDPEWSRVEGSWIALMPLWWRDERVEGIVVRALHDGETLALHLSWRDATRDDDLLGVQSFSDAAALEISVEQDPLLFAMGAVGHPIDIALWRAAWQSDLVSARGPRERWPGMVDDGFPEIVGDLGEQAHVPHARLRAQRRDGPRGAELRQRPRRRPLRQPHVGRLEPARRPDLLDGLQVDLDLVAGAGEHVVEQCRDKALRRVPPNHPTHMSHQDQTDDEANQDALDSSALDKALDGGFAAARANETSAAESVLERIGEIMGSKPRILLRDESAGDTPMLKPLAPEERFAAGKYIVQGELGRGGVGAVRRGHDQEHPSTLETMRNLGGLYWARGRYAEAEPLYLEALEIQRSVLGEEHPSTLRSITSTTRPSDSKRRWRCSRRACRSSAASRKEDRARPGPSPLLEVVAGA